MPDPKLGRSRWACNTTLQLVLQKLGAEQCCGVVARSYGRTAQTPGHFHPSPAAYENCDALRRDLNGSTDQHVRAAHASAREWKDAR